MFAIVEVVNGVSYFELPGVDKYSLVAVVSIENLTPKKVAPKKVAPNEEEEEVSIQDEL